LAHPGWTRPDVAEHRHDPREHALSEEGTTALSSFVQSGGYLLSSIGPPVVGYLHAAKGSWTVPFWSLALTGLVAAAAGIVVLRPVHIEDMETGMKAQQR
jgi:cyanate permease